MTYDKATGWTDESYDLRKAIDDVLVVYYGTDIDKSFTTLEVEYVTPYNKDSVEDYPKLKGVRRFNAKVRFDTYGTAKAKKELIHGCITSDCLTCIDADGRRVSTYNHYGFDKAKTLVNNVLNQLGAIRIKYTHELETEAYIFMIVPEEQYQLYKTQWPVCDADNIMSQGEMARYLKKERENRENH